MYNPSIDDLLTKVENRYSLVITASKRARQIIECENCNSDKPVSAAVGEIKEDKLVIER